MNLCVCVCVCVCVCMSVCVCVCVCVYFNANLLQYYVLRVPRYADRWRWYGLPPIHAPLGQTTLHGGMCICINVLKRRDVRVTVCETVSIV